MTHWFRRNRPAPVEAVRDFVDTMEFMNVLLAKEVAQQESRSGQASGQSSDTAPRSAAFAA